MKKRTPFEVLGPALGMACAAGAGAQTVQDRTSLPLPYGHMLRSPFNFLRGSAGLTERSIFSCFADFR